MRKRIVVTGLGTVCPLGNDVPTTWQNCCRGVSGISEITRFDASDLRTKIAGEVKNFQLPDIIPPKDAKKMDIFIQYAVEATRQALSDSGLQITDDNANDIGVSLGIGIGGQQTIESNCMMVAERGPGRLSPFFIPAILPNMAAGQISLIFGAKNYNAVTLSACASSTHAIGDAMRHIERGDAKAMIVGGSEGALTRLCVGGFAAMKAMSTRNEEPERASRPYDQDRDGFVFSEGSSILIIEELEHALARDAQIYCELAGYGFSSDSFHITSPTVEGQARALKMALKDAGLDPSEIDYVNTHATSTPAGDINELEAVKIALGGHAEKVSISATKSMTGHLLGAAGAIEALITAKAIDDGFIPPTINVDKLDPACDLDITPNVGKERPIRAALSNNFGFGGTNACLAMKKWDGN